MSDEATRRAYLGRLAAINAGLDAVLPSLQTRPRGLHEAMRHAVFAGGGGKRLRPVLLLTGAADLGVSIERALPAALALELVHAYSLVHDDLPCMDDDDVRRGAPSVHAAFGYATAVLAGDAILTLSFEILGRAGNSGLRRSGELAVDLAEASGSRGMVGGQAIDLETSRSTAEGEAGLDPPGILEVHRLKTSRLFSFALATAAHLSEAAEDDVAALREAGALFGLAFQVADDIRDLATDRAPANYAAAVGRARAVEAAHDFLRNCERILEPRVGASGETVRLIRLAAEEMGL